MRDISQYDVKKVKFNESEIQQQPDEDLLLERQTQSKHNKAALKNKRADEFANKRDHILKHLDLNEEASSKGKMAKQVD